MNSDFIILLVSILFAVALFGAIVVYYQFRRQWFDHQFENRKIRQENYQLLIHDISEADILGDDESHQRLMEMLDSLLVIASPPILPQLLEFQKFMRVSNIHVLHNSEIWLEQRDELSRNLIQSLREDIYGYEPETKKNLSQWRPLSRHIQKPGTRPVEVIPFKLFRAKPADSESRRQK